jgi:hypothetical protein
MDADAELRALYRDHLVERARGLMERLAAEPVALIEHAVREYLTEREQETER